MTNAKNVKNTQIKSDKTIFKITTSKALHNFHKAFPG